MPAIQYAPHDESPPPAPWSAGRLHAALSWTHYRTRLADLIKDPYVLEFLSLPEVPRLHETKLEEALISQLQAFLLELGSGFAFIGRQQRLTLDGDHFYPDLVFYQVKLECCVIIDLEVGKPDHRPDPVRREERRRGARRHGAMHQAHVGAGECRPVPAGAGYRGLEAAVPGANSCCTRSLKSGGKVQ
ncbi:MAG: DUF1016 domain-containing protein [Burkholderiaceae bacterium]|nr:DUF1016 domain-containing protein [Burkholderiaceae bacterium]